MARVETSCSPTEGYNIPSPTTPQPVGGRSTHQHHGASDYQSGPYGRQPQPVPYPAGHHYHVPPQQAPGLYYLPAQQANVGPMPYPTHEVIPMAQHATVTEMTHHGSTAAIAVPPRGGAPTSLHVQLPPDPVEDGAEAGRCLVDLHSLRDEWQVAQGRRLSGDKAESELKPLINRTTHIVGSASQSAITRQEMYDLLMFAAEVLRALEQQASASSFCRLADNVALACPTRSSLITNIMHGGHQSLTGGKQLVDAKTTTSVTTTLSAKTRAESASRALARSFLQQSAHGAEGKRLKALYERRRMQCEASNKDAHEYSRQLHANRWNIFWRDEPPRNSCVMPHDNLPWSPELSHW
ncbi:hypothetical protein WJX73_009103 [Symbiochloris irregularis]|uniref:Uncharacterized protein n=1 Tax=Symbiochloris irregularis TaxID=706552 RepID=A0AAW1PQP1_9CHLO